jgi:hypothetical protein
MEEKLQINLLPVNLLFPINEILNPPETVTSQEEGQFRVFTLFIVI